MTFKSILLGAALSLAALPAFAEIVIEDAYARSSSPAARVGASFMVIHNTGDEADRLIDAASDAAVKVELHTHIMNDGVAKMVHVPEGFPVEAGGDLLLQRGGYHVMLMGLTAPFVQGEMVTLTLTFEKAGEMTIMVPIDNERMDGMAGGSMNMEGMNHDGMNMDGNAAMEGMSNN